MAASDAFPLHPTRVLQAVADAYGIKMADLMGPSRRRHVARARNVAYRLVHDECAVGWNRTAELLGRVPAGGKLRFTADKADPDEVAILRAQLYGRRLPARDRREPAHWRANGGR
jgi:hypothetical protein